MKGSCVKKINDSISDDELRNLFDQCYEQGGFDDDYLYKDKDGYYYYRIYVDRGDDFSYLVEEALSKIDDIVSQEEYLRDIISEMCYEAYENVELDKYGDIKDNFIEYLDEMEIEYDEYSIEDFIHDYVYINYDDVFSSVYNENVPVDVIIKGDSLPIYNKVVKGFSEGGEVDDEDYKGTSLENFLTLCGYGIDEFKELKKTGYDSANPETFMESVVVDFNNCSFPSYPKVTFLGGMTLNDIFEKIEKHLPLVIKKDAVGGLWDSYNGCGGLMVDLENDLEIPFGQYDIELDSNVGIDDACGFVGSVWEGHIE